MSKKNKNDKNSSFDGTIVDKRGSHIVEIPDGTLIQSFEAYIKKHPTNKDAIGFLSIQNAKLIAELSKTDADALPATRRKELIDFYMYFGENYYEDLVADMWHNWGQDPLVLRVGSYLANKEAERQMAIYMASLPRNDPRMKEVYALADRLFAIRKDKRLSGCFGKNDIVFKELGIPRTVPRNELEACRRELRYFCARMIFDGGAITVRLYEKGKPDQVFGLINDSQRAWMPLPVEKLRASLEPTKPEDVEEEYTIFQRNPATVSAMKK